MEDEALDESLKALALELAPHFKPGFLQRDLTVFQFRIHDGPAFTLTVTDRDFEFGTGEIGRPTLTLYFDSLDTVRSLLSGRGDGMRAFMEGRYRADGHIVLSQLLLYLFKPDDPTNIYEVQD